MKVLRNNSIPNNGGASHKRSKSASKWTNKKVSNHYLQTTASVKRFNTLNFQRQIYPNTIHLRGILKKYHPGFAVMYVPRECRITSNYFEYYSSGINSLKIPYARLNFADIKSVSCVSVYPPGKFDKEFIRHQFEIIMNNNWTLKKSYYHFINEDSKEDNVMEKNYITIQSRSTMHTKSLTKGHLLPKPLLLERYERKEPLIQPAKYVKNTYTIDNIVFNSKEEVISYKKFVKENKNSVTAVRRKEVIETKNPKKWIKNLAGAHTWGNRELEWYLADQRMLFAANTKDECNKWVLLLNWLIVTQ